ncbi:nucleotidyl transferase AbiEii/AbiGii toxin family protein [Adlercreutzia sp. ZJ138]|uniref:nucleotidyl transferase AbiEii/AbiGii toxin family protein n=1 Tax=Adlercreutzia sp. ZJ138 TaxID=2709405 RepID=UPI00197CB5B3|nr:nucleotidyl transferase AbiEii/AbiGii toxin family protein [Adlercreutzia sp. ZJ138]
MIPRSIVTAWSIEHPWPDSDQVEQDLLLAQAICEIANDELLGRELIIRGGTAFHKLYLDQPCRYSEDLDYVRTSTGGIGDIMKRLTEMGRSLGFEVRTQMTRHPKVFWRFVSTSGVKRKIKLEINTFERSPMLPLVSKETSVESAWYTGYAEVPVFQVEELCATKVRALYQRSKGRDLFDLWLALDRLGVEPEAIVGVFGAYKPEGLTRGLMERNLEAKLADRDFCHDCDSLIVGGVERFGYDAQEAGRLVMEKVISLI